MSNEDNENVSSVGVKFNGNNGGINANNRYWNGVQFNKAVRTTKLRLLIDRNGRGSNGVGTVSYTHLDVYKRQDQKAAAVHIIVLYVRTFRQGRVIIKQEDNRAAFLIITRPWRNVLT